MNFCSDNVTTIAPEIIAALVEANQGCAMPYGNDPWTQSLTTQFSELFETEVVVFPIATGTAANALALSAMAPPYGAIYCHTHSHINADECGAPELFTGGCKLVTLTGSNGKLSARDLSTALEQAGIGVVHHVQPAIVSLTQATEAGTVYPPDEVQQISQVARAFDLKIHMDGARFANALVHLGCTPAEITWKSGVDVLCFGATKNGAMAAEAIVFFNPELANNFHFRYKRGGQLFSKMRFLSVQLLAYLKDDLWLRNATHANQMATQLATGLAMIPEVQLCYPVEANEIFARLPDAMIDDLFKAGFQFYRWQDGEDHRTIVRLVTAFNTLEADVAALIETARSCTSYPALVS